MGAGDGGGRRGPSGLVWALACLVAVVIGGLLALTSRPAAALPVLLEAIDTIGDDPFTPPVGHDIALALDLPDASGDDGPEADDRTGRALAVSLRVASVQSDEPELYGGSGAVAVCDTAQLAAFLAEESEKAEAWADVLGVDPDDIAGYVAELEPVVLLSDTLVVNHGFDDGVATPRLSVLQSGTAVLVDAAGVPVVKCACGNPLLPAAPPEVPELVGDPWEDFDPEEVVSVAPVEEAPAALALADITDLLPARPVLVEQLANAPVPSLCGNAPGVLVDGVLPGLADEFFVGVLGGTAVVGDLDRDGIDEGAVVLECNYGGTAADSFVQVYRGGPEHIGELPLDETSLGFPIEPGAVRIDDGTLVVEGYGNDGDDATCCPSIYASTRWRLADSQFVRDTTDPLDGARLGPGTYGPLRMDMTYMEASEATNLPIDVSSYFDDFDDPGESCLGVDFLGTADGVPLGGIGGGGIVGSLYFSGDVTALSEGGVGIGASRAEVLAAHPDAFAEDNEYNEADDLYVTEVLPSGEVGVLRFVFFDAGDRVNMMITGISPYAELIEGCA